MRKKAAKLKQKTNFIFIIVTTAPRFRIYVWATHSNSHFQAGKKWEWQ